MQFTCKRIETVHEFIDAVRLRVDAFILEQGGKPGWEPDEDDKSADHFIAILDSTVVGTLRVREVEPKVFKIERMVTASAQRQSGVGRRLLSFVMSDLNGKDPTRIWMQAQAQARPFYEKCGFRPISKDFDLWGIPHLEMEFVLEGLDNKRLVPSASAGTD